MQILGLEKVRIMRFSGRKGNLGGVFSGSDPDARDKEEAKGSRAKGKRHFQSAKIGGYKKGNAE